MINKEYLTSNELPQPTNKYLLFDIDKTLVDGAYRITDDRIYGEIQRVQSLGWTLGLSSDTPLKPMQKFAADLGINGPIIAERGALIKIPGRSEIELVPNSADYFSSLKQEIISEAVSAGIPFYYGDATNFLRGSPNLGGTIDNKLILINGYRVCSTNFFARKVSENGQLEIDNELVEQMISGISGKLVQAPFELERDYNRNYGIFIASPKSVNKREATKVLMSELGLRNIGMVGDSLTDILGKDIAVHYGVGNSKKELIEVADYVAESEFTGGVVEILRLIC